jgi:hypothetical protein
VGLIVPGVALIGILAGFVVFLSVSLMAARLVGVGSDERKRRVIVVQSMIALGVAATIWVSATAFCLWSVMLGPVRFFLRR